MPNVGIIAGVGNSAIGFSSSVTFPLTEVSLLSLFVWSIAVEETFVLSSSSELGNVGSGLGQYFSFLCQRS